MQKVCIGTERSAPMTVVILQSSTTVRSRAQTMNPHPRTGRGRVWAETIHNRTKTDELVVYAAKRRGTIMVGSAC